MVKDYSLIYYVFVTKLIAKKQSGIAFGQRTKQKGQSDTDQLIALKRFIKDRFHMDFKREWYIGFDLEYSYITKISKEVGIKEVKRFRWKNPDLLFISRKYGLIIIELDGAVHDIKVKKTDDRNKLFKDAGIKLIVLNIADIKHKKKTLKEILEKEMMKIVG